MNSEKTSESKKRTAGYWLRGMKKQQWAVILLLGLLLAVIEVPVSETDSRTRRSNGQEKTETRTAEKTDLEARLEAVLENVKGVGSVQVMLMTGQDEESFYGSGNTEVTGVLIVAEGAGDSVTVQNIQEAVMALFQIEAHKIKIMKMK